MAQGFWIEVLSVGAPVFGPCHMPQSLVECFRDERSRSSPDARFFKPFAFEPNPYPQTSLNLNPKIQRALRLSRPGTDPEECLKSQLMQLRTHRV